MGKIVTNFALSRVMGATIKKANDGSEFLCIPVSQLRVKNDTVWLDLVGFEDHKFDGQIYSLKQKLSKEQYNSLPVDENGRRAFTPFIGNIYVDRSEMGTQQSAPVATAAQPQSTQSAADDLPW